MVDRASTPVDYGVGRGPAVQGTNIGNAQNDPGKFGVAQQGVEVNSGASENLLNAIVGAAGKLTMKQLEMSQQEAYLSGSAAAGRGEEEANLQSNIFTKDWSTAGWRDTTGRLAQADAEAQTAADMNKLREQSPEEFQAYLAQRRSKLMPLTEGMSLEARKGMLAQQLTSERAAIKNHGVEHMKWIIDQQSKAVRSTVSTSFTGLDRSKTNGPAYADGTNAAFGTVYSNVWLNPNLPQDVKLKLAGEAMSGALARDHQQLFEKFRDTPVQLADGSNGTMFDQLPFDEQTKLAGEYRTSRERTVTARSNAWETQSGLMQAQWDDDAVPMQPFSELQAFLDQGEQAGLLKAGKRESMSEAWAKANRKKAASAGLANDYSTGNVQGIFGKDKDEGEAWAAWSRQQSLAGTPLPQVVASALAIGQSHGFQTAFKGVGELTKAAVQQLGRNEDGNPTNALMLKTVMQTIHQAEANGRNGAMSSYLSGFDDEAKGKIVGFDERVRMGIDPVSAAREVHQIALQTSGLDSTTRNALAATNAKGDVEIMAGIEAKQVLGTLGSDIASWFSGDAAARKALSTGRAWFENEERVGNVLAQSRAALLQELQYTSRTHPYASPAERKSMALSAVAARAIPTDSGPLILPKLPAGITVQSFFGVPNSTMPTTIGKAISQQFPLRDKSNRMAYNAFDGQITITEYNKDSVPVWSQTVDPKSISGAIADVERKRNDQFNATSGAGVTIKAGDGQVTFNGSTTTNIDPTTMLNFRKTLVRDEGIRMSPYADLSDKINPKTGKPIQTVGVGVADTNTYFPKVGPDGKISQKDLNESFMKATDEAARAASSVLKDTKNKKLDMIMLTLAYQSGTNFMGGIPKQKATTMGTAAMPGERPRDAQGVPVYSGIYGDFINSAIRGDKQAAIVALKASPAYRASGETRRQHYLDMLNNAMR